MQHNVPPYVLEALRGVEPGRSEAAVGGLSVVPLVSPPGGAVADGQRASPITEPADLSWRELTPCDPRRLQVQNPLPGAVMVDAGTVLDGGMSTRAVTRTVIVPPGGSLSVRVEPLGARWWDQGPVSRRGWLGAVATGLLLQAAHGDVPSACSARTALWSPADWWDVRDHPPAGMRAAGWALLLDREVVAAWLPATGGVDRRVRASRSRVVAEVGAVSLLASISRGVEGGTLAAHVLGEDAVRDVAVLPRDLRLVDQVTALSAA